MKMKKLLSLLLATAMLVSVLSLSACRDEDESDDNGYEENGNGDDETEPSEFQEFLLRFPDYVPEEYDNLEDFDGDSHSVGIDDNGHWIDITASDYVTFDYIGIEVPYEVHTVTEQDIDIQVHGILHHHPLNRIRITDRAVEDGDLVSIDFAGSIDGVAFDGGTAQGAYVTAGTPQFIDDFLWQIIGHYPSDETIDIYVTFPEDYSEGRPEAEHLDGQEALFVTTINYIVEELPEDREFNDEFVEDELSEIWGWTTIEEMREGAREVALRAEFEGFFTEYIVENAVADVPDSLMETFAWQVIDGFRGNAVAMGYTSFTEYLSDQGVETGLRGLLEAQFDYEGHLEFARFQLTLQAIAEEAEIEATLEDMESDFRTRGWATQWRDFDTLIEDVGVPAVAQVVMQGKVFEYLFENAELMEQQESTSDDDDDDDDDSDNSHED